MKISSINRSSSREFTVITGSNTFRLPFWISAISGPSVCLYERWRNQYSRSAYSISNEKQGWMPRPQWKSLLWRQNMNPSHNVSARFRSRLVRQTLTQMQRKDLTRTRQYGVCGDINSICMKATASCRRIICHEAQTTNLESGMSFAPFTQYVISEQRFPGSQKSE
jgi:hypothetical protein